MLIENEIKNEEEEEEERIKRKKMYNINLLNNNGLMNEIVFLYQATKKDDTTDNCTISARFCSVAIESECVRLQLVMY